MKRFIKLGLVVMSAAALSACVETTEEDIVGGYQDISVNDTPTDIVSSSKFVLNDYAITEVNTGESIAKAKSSETTLNVYPNQSFEFTWDVTANVVLFSDDFLTFELGDTVISPFWLYANPGQGSLVEKAVCEYDNSQRLTCEMVSDGNYYGVKEEVSLNDFIDEYPTTMAVYINACNVLNSSCSREKIGNITLN